MDYLKEKNFLIEMFKRVYGQYYDKMLLKPEYKSKYDIVTAIDYSIEDSLISEIKKEFPEDKIFSEERNPTYESGDRIWIIDPIDGTVNMSHNMWLFGLQGALQVANEIVMSVIFLPFFNEMYYAIKGRGAYCNDQQIFVAQRPLDQSVVSISDYSHIHAEQSILQHKMMEKLYPKIARIRMFGAACIDFSYVASGKTDATICGTGFYWDIAAGRLLCSEAGAKVVNIYGNDFSMNDYYAIAVSSNELMKLLISLHE